MSCLTRRGLKTGVRSALVTGFDRLSFGILGIALAIWVFAGVIPFGPVTRTPPPLNRPYGRVGLVVCYVGPFYINEQMVADGRYI